MKTAFVGTQRGFTLLELSIVLAIIAVILGSGMVIMTASLQASQFNNTVARMDIIEKALLNFAIVNTRIPCPTDPTLTASSANYGYEAGAGTGSAIGVGTGVCSGAGMLPQANFVAGNNIFEGGLPTRALRLSDDYIYDGWGRKFRYAVNPSYTVAGSLPAVQNTAICSSTLTVNDASGAARTTAAIYVLLSHGANGHGAYTSNGTVVNAASVNQNEQANCHCDNNGNSNGYPLTSYQPSGTTTGFTVPTYVETVPSIDSTNSLDDYDDIVTFKEAWQMQALNFPLATRAPPTNLYIADSAFYRIRMVNSAGIISTVAGNGTSGYTGDGGPATAAEMVNPQGVAVDGSGNIYIADTGNNTVRKVNSCIISTYAGNGTAGYSGDGGAATAAELNYEYGGNIGVDSSGNIYIADTYNSRIRKVTASTGVITTVAGNAGEGYSGDGVPATSAELNFPSGVAVDSSGNIFISDARNCRIREVAASTGIITTVAGNGTCGYSGDGGAATSAELNPNHGGPPAGVAVDSSDNIYIADIGNSRIRKVTASTGNISTVAGNGTAGYSGDGGAATSAEIYASNGVAVDSSGNIYIADADNYVVRKVTVATGIITTFAGPNAWCPGPVDGGPATSGCLSYDMSVTLGR